MPTPNAPTNNKGKPAPGPQPGPKDDLKTLPMAEVEKKLSSTPDGLTDVEAKKRLSQYGPNEIKEEKTNFILKFLSYFWGPIPWMIEAAVILSGIVKHWPDFCIILFLLLFNATIGFWEERAAGNAIAALKKRLAVLAKVKRDGKWINPPAREVVPGDVIRLRLGDIIPADARLLAGDEIAVDQSALTGESLPATHKPGEAVFSGSIMRRGEIDALVYATGTNTYFGKTAQLVQEVKTVSHFQRAVMKIGYYLIILAVALVAIILIFATHRGDNILTTIEFCLVLTVAAIPVAMPTVLSVTMAVGARKMAKKEAIVSRLVAIEELAGVDVLCSDKTGTLTENKLTLGIPFTVDNIPADQVILAGALASRAEDNDTIDLAVLGGVKDDKVLKTYQVVHFQPFDPVHKRTEATVKSTDGKQFDVTKGAPQVILKLATNLSEVQAAAEKAINDFAGRGYRSLGVARADEKGKWKFLGILPLSDPPRPQAKAMIAEAKSMGVAVKMVTGDQIAIARETSKELGLGTNILDATALGDSKKKESPEETKLIEQAEGFAQVFPEHKFHIVDILQKAGHIVGMTGDGVNDAPALKKADCGIAVSGATDAARAAASIVLLTSGLSVIIDAIKESRRIFQRMNSYAIYRIAETLRVLFFMTLAIVVFNFYPVTAVMIVMIAVLNDGAILSIAYDNVHYKNKPEAWNMRLVLAVSTVLGVIGVIAAFGLFFLAERVFKLDRLHAQTMMYLKLSVAGHLTIFLTRTRGPFWSIKPAKVLWMAVLGTQILATLIAVYGVFMTPLGWGWAGFVWAYAIAWFLLNDRLKLLAYRIFDPTNASSISKNAVPVTATGKPQAKDKPDTKAQPKPKDATAATPDAKAQAKPDAKAEPTPQNKADTKPDSNAEAKPQVKADATPDPKAQPKPEAKAEPIPQAKADTKPDSDAEAKPQVKADATPDPKAQPKPEANAEPTPDVNAEADGSAKAKTSPDLTPQISKRAYELYEKHGRQSDHAFQDWEQAKLEIGKGEAKTEPESQPNAGPKSQAKPKTTIDLTPQIVERVHELYEELGRKDVLAVEEMEKKQETPPDGAKAESEPKPLPKADTKEEARS
jgi:H+-transporting ATPase